MAGSTQPTEQASKVDRDGLPNQNSARAVRSGSWVVVDACVARPTLSPAPAPNRPGRSRAPVRPHHMNE